MKNITTIYFVRHAESPFRLNNQVSRELSDKGKMDAELLVKIFKDSPISHIYSSHHKRAIDTVTLLKDMIGCEQTLVPKFEERPLRGIEHQPTGFDVVDANKYTFSNPEFSYPGGETNASAQKRGIKALLPILDNHINESVIVSTHGIIMTLMLNYFDPSFDFNFWIKTTKPDVYQVKFNKKNMIECLRHPLS